ncbi:TetR/AcrR family transcriptional regulator [Micromonospora sp. NPDC049836]|uniref:TetR/AcrR family transcriptional regulator n=1 Tax=Micromonospora sp. NPDC049836 TaxID=3364274 RepID=UPI0037B8AD39
MENSSRDRIVRAAARLLAESGREAVTTRAVSRAAGVQAPTIYRQFGDMRGLLDAAASYGFATYLHAQSNREPAADPVDDLRHGWDLHVEFGLANPAFYTLMYGDPRPGLLPTAARVAGDIVRQLVIRVAEVGRLRVTVERAAGMLHAAARGVTLSLIETPPADRDATLAVATREAVLAAVCTDGTEGHATAGAVRHAVALRTALPTLGAELSPAERALLGEWLDRLAGARPA